MKDTPCRATCKLTPDDLCIGCYRLAKEIVNWNKFSEDDRQIILAAITERRESRPYQELVQQPLRPITSAEYRKYKLKSL